MVKVFTYQGNIKQTGSGGSFSCSSLSTCSTSNLAEGSNLYFTDSRAITALTGENISLFINDAGYLTSLSGAVLTSRSLTINGTAFDLSADRTWTISTITGNAGTATTLQTARKINGISFDGSADISTDIVTKAYQFLGSNIKGQNVNGGLGSATGTISLVNNRVFYSLLYLPEPALLTGMLWKQVLNSGITANNYNGLSLMSISGGTLTTVASTTNDGNVWAASAGTIGSKAFSSTYNAAAGYYIGALIMCNSAFTQIPILGGVNSSVNYINNFTNSAKMQAVLSGQTAIPSPQLFSGLSASSTEIWMGLY